jgi:mono/diheme cytochrome c family protein
MKTRIFALFIFSAVVFFNSCTKDEEQVPPVATATPMAQTITSGTAPAIALSSSVVGTSFAWTVVQSGVSGASAGSGSTLGQTLQVTGAVSGTATYTVIPTVNGVSGNAVSVIITVEPIKITYMADVKSIFTASCTPCHLAGGTNPNKWDDYTQAKGKITVILDRVQRAPGSAGFMPKVGTQLTAAQIATLKQWVTDGLLEK